MFKNLFSGGSAPELPRGPLKLNLGCGYKKFDGYLNADKYADSKPDMVMDLETLPWPFPDNSATHVILSHVLEHLGQDPALFLRLIQELWRVCAPGAQVTISVPQFRHDDFLGDPTHVRPILPLTLAMFSRRLNQEWQQQGVANTPLALQCGVDFEMVSTVSTPEEPYLSLYRSGKITAEQLQEIERTQYNVISQIEIVLKAVK